MRTRIRKQKEPEVFYYYYVVRNNKIVLIKNETEITAQDKKISKTLSTIYSFLINRKKYLQKQEIVKSGAVEENELYLTLITEKILQNGNNQ